MLAQSTILILLGPALATAKLWGWPDEFTVVKFDWKDDNSLPAALPGGAGMGGVSGLNIAQIKGPEVDHRVCEGPDPCEADRNGKCTLAQTFDIDAKEEYISLRKEEAAWVDLWRAPDGGYNVYEKDRNGLLRGHCEPLQNQPLTCDDVENANRGQVRLHCKLT